MPMPKKPPRGKAKNPAPVRNKRAVHGLPVPDPMGVGAREYRELCQRYPRVSEQRRLFMYYYAISDNATDAAYKAGYAASVAETGANLLRKNPTIREGVQWLREQRAARIGIEGDDLMRLWISRLTFDVNEIMEYRVSCCPYCWTPDPARPLRTPAGVEYEREKWNQDRLKILRLNPEADPGEYPGYDLPFWDKRRPPNPDCPNCIGRGYGERVLKDTRHLSPAARAAYEGIEQGAKGEVNIKLTSREKAQENLAKALGLFREKEETTTFNVIASDKLLELFDERISKARERQQKVLEERGITVEDVELDD